MKLPVKNLAARSALLVALAALASYAAGLPYAGKWKAQADSASPAKMLEFVQIGETGLTIKIISRNAVCEAKFDGADYPTVGEGVPADYTLAIRKAGPRAFEMVQKLKGKTLYTSTFAVSDDGKTLTETDSGNEAGARIQVVYDRQ
jgi:hypothetical protein